MFYPTVKKFQIIQYIFFLIFVTYLSSVFSQRAIAENLNKENSEQLSSQISLTNPYLFQINSWLEIIQQNQEKFSNQEVALIKSKIAHNYFQIGKYVEAIQYWRSAIEVYQDNQQTQLLAANLTDLAKAYLKLGQTFLAEKKLKEAMDIAESEKATDILYSSYLVLANIQKIQGKYTEAEANLNNSLKYATNPEEKIAIHHNLSQLFEAQSQKFFKRTEYIAAEIRNTKESRTLAFNYQQKAWNSANKAIELSKDIKSLVAVDALLQILNLGSRKGDFNPKPFLGRAEMILSLHPESTEKVSALINLSKFSNTPIQTLNFALNIAERLKDNRSISLANGRLGNLYEQTQQYDLALLKTNKAILAASKIKPDKNLYQWYWQQARIYTILSQTNKAISSYNSAIASLQNIREEVAKSTDEQLDFDQEIEPVYRELLHLLLQEPSSEEIEQALITRDLLQLSELENFFGDDCLELVSEVKELPSKTGLIYTIILPEATHIILKQGKQSKSLKIDISQSQLEELVKQWRSTLEDRTEEDYWSFSQTMYDLLIKPIKPELDKNQLETLIFVNDGILKNVPMAALYDGQRFLVENYRLSLSLGLNLQIRGNEMFSSKRKVLAFGLSKKIADLLPLPFVEKEIQLISKLVDVKQFLNTEFTTQAIEEELGKNNFPIIHFATHSQFDGTLESSFLATYQEKVSLSNLERILNQHQIKFPQNPIELLILSACETAAGNKNATLGLSGVAIRSGIRRVIGSLWSVNTPETYLIEKFYNGLIKDGISPDAALRQAQIMMIRDLSYHASIWSNLILIIN